MGYRALVVACGVVLGVGACGGEEVELVVDLRTDLVAGEEFSATRVALITESRRLVEERAVRPNDDYERGARLAEFRGLAMGTHRLEVTLVNALGVTVVERPVLVDIAGGTQVTTVLVTRDCRGVRCEGGDSAAALEACLGGECVSARCADGGDAEACGDPGCDADADCAVEVSSCAESVCVSGRCLLRSIVDACEQVEWCHPDQGCVARGSTACEPRVLMRRPGEPRGVVATGGRIGVLYTVERRPFVQGIDAEGEAMDPPMEILDTEVNAIDVAPLDAAGRVVTSFSYFSSTGFDHVGVREVDLTTRTAGDRRDLTGPGSHAHDARVAVRDGVVGVAIRNETNPTRLDVGLVRTDLSLERLSSTWREPKRRPVDIGASPSAWLVLTAEESLLEFSVDGDFVEERSLASQAAGFVEGPDGLVGLLLFSGGELALAPWGAGGFELDAIRTLPVDGAAVSAPVGRQLPDGTLRLAWRTEGEVHLARVVDGAAAYEPLVVGSDARRGPWVVESPLGPVVVTEEPDADDAPEVVVRQVCEPSTGSSTTAP